MKNLFIIIVLSIILGCDNTCHQYTMDEPEGVIISISRNMTRTTAVIEYNTTLKSGGGYSPSFPIKAHLKMIVPNTYQIGDTILLVNKRMY